MNPPAARVLVVDDNEMNRDMLSKRLQRRGFQVATARDGLEALDMIAAERYEIVLLDLMMPGADGFEVLRRLRGVHSAAMLPVIIATSRDRSEDLVRALQLGANDYIVKPLEFEVLIARINAQLASRQQATTSSSGRMNDSPPIAAAASGPDAGADPGGVKVPGRSSVGRYTIVRQIGAGGMGEVFLARDPALDRPVAIKLIRNPGDEVVLRERFAREARAVAQLAHPNIVTIFDVGEYAGQPFIAMEFVPGDTLAHVIHRRPRLPLLHKLSLLDQLCAAIGHAHRAGIIHRDIKPANLMVTPDGVIKVLDFGIARFADSKMTQAGLILGTPNYMSPEQLSGRPVDHRSDVFALGAVIYELISHKQAFPGRLEDGLLSKVVNDQPESLRAICPGLNERLIELVERALQKSAADRPQDVESIRADLAEVRRESESAEETLPW